MVKKLKELKQVYIPYENTHESITDEDKISLEKTIKSLKIRIIIAPFLFIVSFSITCILIYEFFAENYILLIDDGIKVAIFAFCLGFNVMLIFYIHAFTKSIKDSQKILENTKIKVVRGVVESQSLGRGSHFFAIAGGISGGAPYDLKNYINRCGPGHFIELRYNPYTIRRIDDNLYDVNFIYEYKYLSEIKDYEAKLLKLQEELNNTNISPRRKRNVAYDIAYIKKCINYNNEELSKLPKKIQYAKENNPAVSQSVSDYK